MCGAILLGLSLFQMYRPPVSQVSSASEVGLLLVLGSSVMFLALFALIRLSPSALMALCCQCSDLLPSKVVMVMVRSTILMCECIAIARHWFYLFRSIMYMFH